MNEREARPVEGGDRRLRRRLLAASAIAATVGLLAGTALTPTAAQAKDKFLEVVIRNGPDEPVSVSGSVDVVGEVDVTGDITVGNGPADPVPIAGTVEATIAGPIEVAAPPQPEPYYCWVSWDIEPDSVSSPAPTCPAPEPGTKLHITDVSLGGFHRGSAPEDARITAEISIPRAGPFPRVGIGSTDLVGDSFTIGRAASAIVESSVSDIRIFVLRSWADGAGTAVYVSIIGYVEEA